MSFYDQYPQIELDKVSIFIKKLGKNGVPIIFLIILLNMYFKEKALFSKSVFNLGGIDISFFYIYVLIFLLLYLFILFVLIPKGERYTKKSLYLKKYGTKKDIECKKTEDNMIFGWRKFYFYIQGQEIILKEPIRGKHEGLLVKHNFKEGDVLHFIYNPMDFKDYKIDYEKLFIK